MKPHTRIVWLGFASLALAPVWGIGLVVALMALRTARNLPSDSPSTSNIKRDLRGGILLARAGLVLNVFVLIFIAWTMISTLL